MESLAQEKKLQTIKLTDGKEYRLSRLTLNMLCEIEDSLAVHMEEIASKPTMKAIRLILFVKMKPNHPDITEQQIGELIDQDMMQNIGELLK